MSDDYLSTYASSNELAIRQSSVRCAHLNNTLLHLLSLFLILFPVKSGARDVLTLAVAELLAVRPRMPVSFLAAQLRSHVLFSSTLSIGRCLK